LSAPKPAPSFQDPAVVGHVPALAAEVEAALSTLYTGKDYAAKARSLLFNIAKNEDLRLAVIRRNLSAEELVKADPRDLAPDQLKKKRAAYKEAYFALRQVSDGTHIVGWSAGTSGKLEFSHKYDNQLACASGSEPTAPSTAADSASGSDGNGEEGGGGSEGDTPADISTHAPHVDHEQGEGAKLSGEGCAVETTSVASVLPSISKRTEILGHHVAGEPASGAFAQMTRGGEETVLASSHDSPPLTGSRMANLQAEEDEDSEAKDVAVTEGAFADDVGRGFLGGAFLADASREGYDDLKGGPEEDDDDEYVPQVMHNFDSGLGSGFALPLAQEPSPKRSKLSSSSIQLVAAEVHASKSAADVTTSSGAMVFELCHRQVYPTQLEGAGHEFSAVAAAQDAAEKVAVAVASVRKIAEATRLAVASSS